MFTLGNMTKELGTEPWSVGEEELIEAAPRVRALQIQRYEDLWKVVQDHIHTHEEAERPIDPRYLEIGVRILKEEAGLYRLNRSIPVSEDAEDTNGAIDRAQLVEAQLQELEARAKGKDAVD